VEHHVSTHPLIAAIVQEILPKLAQLSAVPPLAQLTRLPPLLRLLPLRLQLLRLPLPLGLLLLRLQLLRLLHQLQQHHLETLQLAMGPILIPQRMLVLPMVQVNKCCAPSRTPLLVEVHAILQPHTAARLEL
jgi:hypothetical protein